MQKEKALKTAHWGMESVIESSSRLKINFNQDF